MNDWSQVRALFERALELSGDARAAFLDRECADPALRMEVQSLLDADARAANSPLADNAAALMPVLSEQTAPFVSCRIGAWRLLSELGRGGMGTVYLAQRDDGVYQQIAALKVLHPELADVGLAGRLREERQILAGLDHPGIARLLDGGSSEDGRPYLVLDYVDGLPIDQWCDTQRLSIAARIEVFLQVCAAVEHAHRRLVVHRDLKPSNILVSAQGLVKLLDFGIAKLLQNNVSAERTGRMFTPAYASPEQVRGEPVTTGVDVHALGLLLYELLSGQRAFGDANSTPAVYEHAIVHQIPALPSQLKVGDAAAAARQLTPATLARTLRGDLDAIVSKALRKETEQRYASVAALAEDLRRHLQHQPVHARRGHVRYQVGRFLRRHALASALSAVAVLSMAIGLGVALWQAQQARFERNAAQSSAQQAESVAGFLVNVFTAADPTRTEGRDPPVSELLAGAIKSIDSKTEMDADLRSTLLTALGNAQLARGAGAEALSLMQRAEQASLNAAQPETRMRALVGLARALNHGGRLAQSNEYIAQARQWALLHPKLPERWMAQAMLLEGINLHRLSRKEEALVVLEQLTRHYEARGGFGNIAAIDAVASHVYVLNLLKRHDEALALSTRLHEQLLTDPKLPLAGRKAILGAHALALMGVERHAEAQSAYRAALVADEAIYGVDHVRTMITLNNLAQSLSNQGRHDEGLEIMTRVIAVRRRAQGDDHPALAGSLVNAAVMAEQGAKNELALAYFREAVAIYEKADLPDDPKRWRSLVAIARVEDRIAQATQAPGSCESAQSAAHMEQLNLALRQEAQILAATCLQRVGDIPAMQTWLAQARAQPLAPEVSKYAQRLLGALP